MITDAILNILFAVPLLILDSLPSVEFSFPDNIYNGLETLLSNVAYVVPITALMPILVSSFAISMFKIVWALGLRVKSFIPGMAN